MDMLRLTLRVDLAGDRLLGPGKILLLEAIEHTGSISQAGRMIGMSYRKAWWLVEDMNSCFCDPVIEARRGGSNGGGARLTGLATGSSAVIAPSRPRRLPPPGRISLIWKRL